jgi:prephenate dehydratase
LFLEEKTMRESELVQLHTSLGGIYEQSESGTERPPGSKMSLGEIRKQIDRIDLELLALLEERMELGLRVRRFKAKPVDPRREQAVRKRAMQSSLALVETEFAGRLFNEIMNESKRLQENGHRLVAFQGEHGAYSEVVARSLSPDAAYLPCSDFADVFTGVEHGYYDLGVVPVENSLAGPVSRVNELLATTSLKVVGEARLPVHHCLLVPRDTDHRSIRTVYSHPQALSQCRGYLSSRQIEARPYYDTAGAARMLARDKPWGTAAIASSLAAKLYGLDILASDIEDDASNSTRFLMLSRAPVEAGNKCSVVFSTPHEAGMLLGVLELFARSDINLTRIASMPIRSDPGTYCFFVDLEGSDQDPKVIQALEEAAARTVSLKLLGCYPAASPAETAIAAPVGFRDTVSDSVASQQTLC